MDKGILKEAKTQYTDLKGTIAIDFAGAQDTLASYAATVGVDIAKYNPVGIQIYGVRGEIISLNILCIERSSYPIEKGQDLPTTPIKVKDTFENFLKHLIRIEIVLIEKHRKVTDYNII
ncbi:MAG: hypothetical protein ACYDCN_09380 [Bacteroidia bacterium]